MRATLFLLPFLLACRQEHTITWLEGARYGWAHFNHRLTHWQTELREDAVDVAVIGGTSTTGIAPALPKGCSPETCEEFPITDEADISVRWGRAETKVYQAVETTADLVVGTEGNDVSVEVDLPEKGRSVFGLIQGFSIDLGEPLSGGEACYTPKNGWMPTHLALWIDDTPKLSTDGMTASFSVYGAFAAGESLEKARECVDEVNDQATAHVIVDVLVVAGVADDVVTAIEQTVAYDYGTATVPVEQPEPTPIDIGDMSQQLGGWSALDWQFHVKDPDGRGAYLRTLGFEVVGDTATGFATNYSPGTQLSGFDYTFEGTLLLADVDADVTRGTVTATLPAALDASGDAVVTSLPLKQ